MQIELNVVTVAAAIIATTITVATSAVKVRAAVGVGKVA